MKKIGFLIYAVAVSSFMYANDCSGERNQVKQLMAKYSNDCNKEYIYLKEQQANQQAELEYNQAQKSLSYEYENSYNTGVLTPIFSTEKEAHLERTRRAIGLDSTYEHNKNVVLPNKLKYAKEMNAIATRQALERCELLNNQIKSAKYNLKVCQKKK